jgi:hypothetical protein
LYPMWLCADGVCLCTRTMLLFGTHSIAARMFCVYRALLIQPHGCALRCCLPSPCGPLTRDLRQLCCYCMQPCRVGAQVWGSKTQVPPPPLVQPPRWGGGGSELIYAVECVGPVVGQISADWGCRCTFAALSRSRTKGFPSRTGVILLAGAAEGGCTHKFAFLQLGVLNSKHRRL